EPDVGDEQVGARRVDEVSCVSERTDGGDEIAAFGQLILQNPERTRIAVDEDNKSCHDSCSSRERRETATHVADGVEVGCPTYWQLQGHRAGDLRLSKCAAMSGIGTCSRRQRDKSALQK